jgi:DNA polymerase-3 subunit epsilon/ATP-dependent DNA helicase DinG
VVVINHAMLMSDIVMGGGLLPEHDVLIIDEAHHLQDAATRHLGISVNQFQLAADLSTASGENGAVAAYGRALQAAGGSGAALDPLPQALASALEAAGRAAKLAAEAFSVIAEFTSAMSKDTGGAEIRLVDAVRSLPNWEPVKISAENLVAALGETTAGMRQLLSRQERINPADIDRHATVLDLSAACDSIESAHSGLSQALLAPQDGFVYWLRVMASGRAAEVNGAPLDVGPLLREKLFDRENCVVLTGATLSHEGSFQRMRSAIGLDEANELKLGSPFDYREAALIAIPEDISEPGGHGYAQDTVSAISSIARGVRGRTLVLFTSNSALENARRSLFESLAADGIKVIGQGHDGPPHRIMQTLASETDIVALGTSSLWEGADLPGASLDAVVMARLPFPVPSEPVFAARNELFEDGFNEYAVPEAVLRFRQGFGRLIRSKTDRGIFVALDRRILTKGYGRSFQRSLPKATVRRVLLEDLERTARDWKEGVES